MAHNIINNLSRETGVKFWNMWTIVLKHHSGARFYQLERKIICISCKIPNPSYPGVTRVLVPELGQYLIWVQKGWIPPATPILSPEWAADNAGLHSQHMWNGDDIWCVGPISRRLWQIWVTCFSMTSRETEEEDNLDPRCQNPDACGRLWWPVQTTNWRL